MNRIPTVPAAPQLVFQGDDILTGALWEGKKPPQSYREKDSSSWCRRLPKNACMFTCHRSCGKGRACSFSTSCRPGTQQTLARYSTGFVESLRDWVGEMQHHNLKVNNQLGLSSRFILPLYYRRIYLLEVQLRILPNLDSAYCTLIHTRVYLTEQKMVEQFV